MKTALVTGASRGIGKAIADQLKLDGYKVITAARTNADLILDLMKQNDVESLKAIGDLDILVNNLGSTLEVTDPFCGMRSWAEVLRFNFLVAVDLCERFIPDMKKKGWGRVINICSTSSLENNGPVPYCAAKAALAAYTRSMGRVLAPTGVIMSGLIVGAIKTEGGHFDKAPKEHVDNYIKTRLPLGRFGEERSIADMVSFLCTDKADFMHGSLIPIDGGQMRNYCGQV